ncbi:MAG: hypothetical protein JSW27_11920 [Phycisphaerales bacterium]|nr:MAG: hypothetical protein JSW27_11920 [Phycisphaerales bacterium]
MPITYTVEDNGTFVHTTARGAVTDEDLLNYQAALLADARVRPGFDELFDATAARESGLSEAMIEKMIEVDRSHAEKLRCGRCAVVVWDGFELADQFVSRHGGPHTVMVFCNLDVAELWLGRKKIT